MAEAPVPDRPNIHSNASPGLKDPWGHADVLTQTMRCIRTEDGERQLATYWFITRNSATIAAWFVVLL
jgi:hypothetical protein